MIVSGVHDQMNSFASFPHNCVADAGRKLLSIIIVDVVLRKMKRRIPRQLLNPIYDRCIPIDRQSHQTFSHSQSTLLIADSSLRALFLLLAESVTVALYVQLLATHCCTVQIAATN